MAKVTQLNLSKEMVKNLQHSGIASRIQEKALEFLINHTPEKHKKGWEVDARLEPTGLKITVYHTNLDPNGVAQFEYGLDTSGVVRAPIRQLEVMLEEEVTNAIMEAML